MMLEEEKQVKRTAVYPQVHHLEEQMVFPFISLLCHPFFSHPPCPPTTSQDCSPSHLRLIKTESAAVNCPTSQHLFICSEWSRADFHADDELSQGGKSHLITVGAKHLPVEGETFPLTPSKHMLLLIVINVYLCALHLSKIKSLPW